MRTNGGILLLIEYFLFFFQLFHQHTNMVMHCYLVLYSY